MRNRLVPKCITLTFVQRSFKVMASIDCVTITIVYLGNR